MGSRLALDEFKVGAEFLPEERVRVRWGQAVVEFHFERVDFARLRAWVAGTSE